MKLPAIYVVRGKTSKDTTKLWYFMLYWRHVTCTWAEEFTDRYFFKFWHDETVLRVSSRLHPIIASLIFQISSNP